MNEHVWRSKLICTFVSAGSQCAHPSWLHLFGMFLCLFSFCLLPCCHLCSEYAQPPCRDGGSTLQTSHIPPSYILHSSLLANTQSSLSKHPLTQSSWPLKEAGQPQSHQPYLPSHCSAFPRRNSSATCPVWLPVVCCMYSHHRDKHSCNFVWSAQIPCDGWM